MMQKKISPETFLKVETNAFNIIKFDAGRILNTPTFLKNKAKKTNKMKDFFENILSISVMVLVIFVHLSLQFTLCLCVRKLRIHSCMIGFW